MYVHVCSCMLHCEFGIFASARLLRSEEEQPEVSLSFYLIKDSLIALSCPGQASWPVSFLVVFHLHIPTLCGDFRLNATMSGFTRLW